jgi:hypothetical protein
LAVVVLWVLSGCGGQLERHEAELAAQELSSIAAQGALLAGGVADGEVTAAYARVYGEELAAQADGLAEGLRGRQAPRELAVGRLVGIAEEVASELEALARLPEARAAQRLARQLAGAAGRADALGRLA